MLRNFVSVMTDVRKFVFKDARYLIEAKIHETARRDLCTLKELSRKYSRGDHGPQSFKS